MKREVNMRIAAKITNPKKDENETQKNTEGIITDPFGSWTGVNVDDLYEKPIQDVDDL